MCIDNFLAAAYWWVYNYNHTQHYDAANKMFNVMIALETIHAFWMIPAIPKYVCHYSRHAIITLVVA
jgi:hypothetical protein